MNYLIDRLDKLLADLDDISAKVLNLEMRPEWYRLNAAWHDLDDVRRVLRDKQKSAK